MLLWMRAAALLAAGVLIWAGCGESGHRRATAGAPTRAATTTNAA